MLELIKRLYPIARSLTGPGVEKTLSILSDYVGGLEIHQVPSGTKIWGWTVPPVWSIRNAWIECPDGRKICNFTENSLHVVGYSEPIDVKIDLEDLQKHLHSRTDLTDAIPYVTSYYRRTWGFCLQDRIRRTLGPGKYRVMIDSEFDHGGDLLYGEYTLPGATDREVLFSTNICHPHMAENETSGIAVVAELSRRLSRQPHRFTYRFLFLPETIGAICYKYKRQRDRHMIVAGCHVYCVGRADQQLAFIVGPPIDLASRAARAVGKLIYALVTDRGSDERQFCHPPDPWPYVALTRGTTFREYHTSLDRPELLKDSAIEESLTWLEDFAHALESNVQCRLKYPCEPFFEPIEIYSREALDVAYACHGSELIDIAANLKIPIRSVERILTILQEHGVIETKRCP